MARDIRFASGVLGFGVAAWALCAVPALSQRADTPGDRRAGPSDARISRLADEVKAGTDVIKSFMDTGSKFRVFAERLVAWEAECMMLQIQVEKQVAQALPDVYLKPLRDNWKTCQTQTRKERKTLALFELEMERLHTRVKLVDETIGDAERLREHVERKRSVENKAAEIGRIEITAEKRSDFEKERLSLGLSLESVNEKIKKFEAMPR